MGIIQASLKDLIILHSSQGLEANKALKSPLNVEVRNTSSVTKRGNRPMGDAVCDHTVSALLMHNRGALKLYQPG